jgi:uncharacterized protein YndB with AHSA1/START domain
MDEKVLFFEVIVDAPIESVWQAWTTIEGIKSFFAPDCKLELWPTGAYEMYFNLGAPEGLRGGEGCTILAIEERKMLSFTWNAPPEFPKIREQWTHVCLRFAPLGADRTKVTFIQDGWGSNPEWIEVYQYFENAWGQIVLPRLQARFKNGPIQWQE